ncbi:MAG: amidohydrolase family protein [Phycisphaerales bacterium]|nr:amidohydrolase family protein [Phycisphaerales bacterium]
MSGLAGRALAVVAAVLALAGAAGVAEAQVAVRAKTLHTMGPAGTISEGVVVMADGKVAAVGPAASIRVPNGYRVLVAEVAMPGLVDARSTVGLSGIYNTKHDSDQIERSSPMQPELRALDAYNPQERLVGYLRSFGVTTVHTGHGPGELISGQTIVVKTTGNTVEEALVASPAMVVATLDPSAQKEGGKSPGTRGKMMSMLRQELIKAKEYQAKVEKAGSDAAKRPARDLRMEMLGEVLAGKVPLAVTAHRAQDIASVLRLREEFGIKVVLDGGAEAHTMIPEIKAAGVPVLLHPTMMRQNGEAENASFATAAKLKAAGVPFALQSGFEAYVPKTRVVLLEAGVAAAYGLSKEDALAAITIDAARLIGQAGRVGSLEVGKDGDVALYSGDPLEYTTHCTAVVIDGKIVFEGKR